MNPTIRTLKNTRKNLMKKMIDLEVERMYCQEATGINSPAVQELTRKMDALQVKVDEVDAHLAILRVAPRF